jgi:predicted dehydrogenase
MAYSVDSPARVGIIGCGNIAPRYVEGMRRFGELKIVGCADLFQEPADRLAARYGIRAYASIDDLLADGEIDIVVNITPPTAHASVTIQALTADKNVYVEKPIVADSGDLAGVQRAAESSGKRLGSAPDTFLGSAGQTARAAVDRGAIGEVLGASAFVTYERAEEWHPNPAFLFQPGGGPMLDMGPYYISSLVNLLGPVDSVAGFARIGARTRRASAPDRVVDLIEVTTETHASASLRFAGGAIATVMFSFDVWDSELPRLEVYGTLGTLSLPDPNNYDGAVRIRTHTDSDWRVLEPVVERSGDPADEDIQLLRGMGVRDLALSLNGQPQRTSASLGAHVLEVLEAITKSSASDTVVRISSQLDRPEPADSSL